MGKIQQSFKVDAREGAQERREFTKESAHDVNEK